MSPFAIRGRRLVHARAVEAPPAEVLAAFGAAAPPVPLPGGHGRTWGVAELVLKPVDDPAEGAEIAEIVARLPEDHRYRVARPVRAAHGPWIVDGWSAWTMLAGAPSTVRWSELLAAAAAFHQALAPVERPAFVDRRADRWRVADRVAWGELPWVGLRHVAHVERLVAARRPVTLPSQLVHCDLVGNVLFADGLPPGIIDLSLYWRPVGYSAAVVVGDAIAWEGADPSITEQLERFADWPQLLVRAVLFRVVSNELARQDEPERADLREEYRPVVDLVVSLAGAGNRLG